MAEQQPRDFPLLGIARNEFHMISHDSLEQLQSCTPKWYFTRREIEDLSPSRKDGIDFKKETQLRKLYCSFIQDLGKKLKVPQLTIATAMMFCHRFYLRQSHAKNDWQTIASVSMFLACKVEETPRLLMDVVVVAYETIHRSDPATAHRIKSKDVYEKQKELLLIGERLLLATIGFDVNIQHPYKPLVTALKRLNISHSDLPKVAWNFVNDWVRATLCLQYKPHFIAAGSLFLAAKFLQVKLPSEKGRAWWMEFDVSPKQLEDVIQQMLGLLERNERPVTPSVHAKAIQATAVKKMPSIGPQTQVLSGSITARESRHGIDRDVGGGGKSTHKSQSLSPCDDTCTTSRKGVLQSQMSDSGRSGKSTYNNQNMPPSEDTCITVKKAEVLQAQAQTSDCGSIVEDGDDRTDVGEVQARMLESNKMASCKIVSVTEGFSKIDKDRIKEALKRRRSGGVANKDVVVAVDGDVDDDSWIVRELENGIEQAAKKHRCLTRL